MYDFYSSLYPASSKVRAATWVQAQNKEIVPSGYMKAKSFLYDAAGNLRKSTTLQANTTAANYLFVVTPSTSGSKEYYSRGEVGFYHEDAYRPEYRIISTSKTSNATADVVKNLAASLNENGGYPINAQGQTYGSALLSEVIGFKPNLISAIGTDNVKGYVRMDELDPYTATPAEAAALAASTKDSVLPLYDLNGKVIGTFVQNAGVTSNSKEFTKVTFDAARTKVAAGSYTTPVQTVKLPKTDAELTALAEKSLAITPYSRNNSGQTYGSESMSGSVGYSPDLIAVISTDNVMGYVKKEDLNLPMSSGNQGNRNIPVYNLDGKVIGEFKIEVGQSSNDPTFADLSIEEAREKLAAG